MYRRFFYYNRFAFIKKAATLALMKKIWKIACVLGLMIVAVGCTTDKSSETTNQKSTEAEKQEIEKIEVDTFEKKIVETKKLNDFCGEGIGICASGMTCLPRTAGEAVRVCKPSVVDESEKCSVTDQNQVCGVRDGERRTYLNACFAKRNGAEVEEAGTCKEDIGEKSA